MEKVRIELGPVQETLLLPLWGRAVESKRKRPRLVDRAAVDVVSRVDYDFTTIAAGMSEITRMAWIARSLAFDEVIRAFLERNPGATVVNVGCGLDTTFERVDDGRVIWYDLDLPDVIALRSRFMQESERRTFLPLSVLEEEWMERIQHKGEVLFVAGGVLYYFTEEQMRRLIRRIGDSFAPCELVFDCASPAGVEVANRRVIAAGGMKATALLRWGIRSATEMTEWDARVRVLSEYPMFRRFRRGLSPRRRFGAWLSDRYRIMSIVHLQIA
ncbi:class I SAM-dependent methyltransferase [Salinispira pacifica]